MCFFPLRCIHSSRNSAQACAARRYDAFASGKPDSSTGDALVPGLSAIPIADRPKLTHSCRHIIAGAIAHK